MIRVGKGSFSTVLGTEGDLCHYPTRLDTYSCGCQHDCAYCYAKSILDFRNLWDARRPKVADPSEIAKAVDQLRPGEVVRLGGMTDCLMPLERFAGVTKATIQLLNARKVPYLIVTKSDLIADDDYIAALDPKLAHVQITVTSTSDEPNFLKERATPPTMRLRAAETLSGAGFDVSLRISPYIPELIDMERLNTVKVDKCLVEFLRVNHWIEKWLGRDFPTHSLRIGQYRHLPLMDKLEMLRGFEFPEMTVCDDVPRHYRYFQRKFNHNPDDCCNLRK